MINEEDLKLDNLPNKPITKEELQNSSLNKMEKVGMSDYKVDALEAFSADVTAFANAYFDAMANDGKIDLKDAPLLFTPVMDLVGDITGGKFKGFGEQLGDVDKLEVETLKSDTNAKVDGLDLPLEQKDLIKASYALGIDAAHFYYCFKQNKKAGEVSTGQ